MAAVPMGCDTGMNPPFSTVELIHERHCSSVPLSTLSDGTSTVFGLVSPVENELEEKVIKRRSKSFVKTRLT